MQLSALASIATVVGIVLTFGGLIFAGYQLRLTNSQLQAAREAVEAQTIFNIQSDGREILRSFDEDKTTVPYLFEHDANKIYNEEIIAKANQKIRVMLQYYSTVFNQKRAGAITEKFWKSFATEICQFFQLPAVYDYWKKSSPSSAFSSEFQTFVRNC